MNRPVGETEIEMTIAASANLINSTAFFRLLWTAPVGGVEHNPIAGLKGRNGVSAGWFDPNRVRLDSSNPAKEDSAMPRRPASHRRLMIRAAKKERSKSA